VTPERVHSALAGLVGTFDQVPPAFSARRVGGRRLYELARRGEAVPRSATPVTVHAFELRGMQADRLDVEVRCSAGTYVRALARDLGERLGTGAHLEALRRTRSGSFGLERAVSGDALDATAAASLLRLSELLGEVPASRVNERGRRLVRHGRDLEPDAIDGPFPDASLPLVRLVDEQGDLIALAVPRAFEPAGSGLPRLASLHPEVVLVDGGEVGASRSSG
jgi:tRNA pseudouridine55 synthase